MRRRKNKLDNFIEWIFPSPPPEEMEAATEEVLQRLKEQMPEAVEAFRFYPDAGRLARSLGPYNQIVLTAVSQLGDNAHKFNVMKRVGQMSANSLKTFDTLYDLEAQGLLSSTLGPFRELGGEFRIPYYKFTDFGQRVFDAMPAMHEVPERLGDLA